MLTHSLSRNALRHLRGDAMRRLPAVMKAVVASRGEAVGLATSPGELVLVERARPRVLVIRCPCGCGDDIVINLDRLAGPAWRLYEKGAGVTVFPSVWRDSGCESHFVIAGGRIFLFDGVYDEVDATEGAELDEAIDEWLAGPRIESALVLSKLKTSEWQSAMELADILDELPWDVHTACRALVRKGLAIEGQGRLRGSFKRN